MGYQKCDWEVKIWTDADHAGCLRTRKSTSGIAQLGPHLIKSWSTTQSVVALSVGEAEYYGLVRGASVGLGMASILADFGLDMRVRVNSDSSTGIGIASRTGLGKVRHIEVAQLWVQEKVRLGTITLTKVPGKRNLSDALTKFINKE